MYEKYKHINKKYNKNLKLPEQKHNSKYKSLSYGERNSRMLLVAGIFGTIYFLYKIACSMLEKAFNVMYINKKNPLGGEHLLIPMFLASISIIFFACIMYCYAEFFNFCNYENTESKINYEKNADDKYKLLLGVLKISVILFIFCSFILIIIFNNNGIWVMILTCIAFSIAVISLRKEIIKYIRNFIINFIRDRSLIIGIIFTWIGIFFTFLYFGAIFIGDTEKAYSTLKFNSKNGISLNIEFKNKLPENVNVIIINSNKKNKTLKIQEDQFSECYVKATQEDYKNETSIDLNSNKFIYKNSSYDYFTNIKLDNCFNQGKNSVLITFNINETGNRKKTYEIRDDVNIIGNEIQFTKNEINVNLD